VPATLLAQFTPSPPIIVFVAFVLFPAPFLFPKTFKSLPQTENAASKNHPPRYRRMSQLQKVAEKLQNLIPLFGALLLEMCFCSSFAPPRPNRTLKSLPHTETTALKNCPHHRRRLRLQKVAEKIQK